MSMFKMVSTIVATATIAGLSTTQAQQPEPQPAQQVTVTFGDPSRPGTLHVNLLEGSISVKGENRKDVAIEATQDDRRRFGRGRLGRSGSDAPSAGLRRLDQVGGFTVDEANNVMTIGSGGLGRRLDLAIRVPTRTNLRINTTNGRTLAVEDIEGDIEVNNTSGPVTLTNVSGSVVANSVAGGVVATLTRVTAQKAMAFTSLSGRVDVTLPASTKANLKLRSDQGGVFTDFDVQLRPSSAPKIEDTRRSGGGRFRLEANDAIYGTINGGGPEIEVRSFSGSVYLRKGS